MSIKSEIGLKIAKLLEVKGWSETKLANKANIPQPTVHRITSGESKSPRLANIKAIAEALNVSVAHLTSETTDSGLSSAANSLITLIEEKSKNKEISDEFCIALADLIKAI